MSSDRELLELAAKAAGINVRWERDPAMPFQERWQAMVPCGWAGQPSEQEWNPLREDGDALRLAVRRRIRFWIEGGTEAEWNQVWTVAQGAGPEVFVMHRDHGGDANAATRRAIVMAAADGAEGVSP